MNIFTLAKLYFNNKDGLCNAATLSLHTRNNKQGRETQIFTSYSVQPHKGRRPQEHSHSV